jgi:hypothetical protein
VLGSAKNIFPPGSSLQLLKFAVFLGEDELEDGFGVAVSGRTMSYVMASKVSPRERDESTSTLSILSTDYVM